MSGLRLSRPELAGLAPPARPASRPVLRLSELLAVGALLVAGLTGWGALIVADLGVYRLWTALPVAGVLAALLALALRRWPVRPSIEVDRGGLILAGVLAVLAALLFLPGFPYYITDKDPGVYVAQGMHIARTGSVLVSDPLGAHLGQVPDYVYGSRWPALFTPDITHRSSALVPQFYHLWPSLLAVAESIGGWRLVDQTAPLCGVVAVVLAGLVARRALAATGRLAGWAEFTAGGVAGALLALNMMEVWQAKYPSTEILTQALFLGTLLCLIVAVTEGWAPAAGLSGLLLGVAWLVRADMLLVYGMALLLGGGLLAVGRWDARCWWFAGGLAVTLPHVWWQAYVLARWYSLADNVPRLSVVLGLTAGGFALAYGLSRLSWPRRIPAWLARPTVQRRFGAGVWVVFLGLTVLGFERANWFGEALDYRFTPPQHTYDEIVLRRLEWFIGYPGWAAFLLGLAVVLFGRWRAARWIACLPGPLLLCVYGYNARISSRLMWWVRRFVPDVLPAMVLAMTVAIVVGLFLVARHRRWAPVSLVSGGVLAYLLVLFAGQSAPLLSHHEYAGSHEVLTDLAGLSGGAQGVYLFQQTPCCLHADQMFGLAVWLTAGELSSELPETPAEQAAYVQRVAQAFPAKPVFLVWSQPSDPQLPGVTLKAVQAVDTTFPMWQEADTTRPDHNSPVQVSFTVFRVTGTNG